VALLRAETTIEVCSYMQLKAFFCQHEHVFYLISLTGIQNEGPFPPSREYIPSVRSAGFAPAIQLPTTSLPSHSASVETSSPRLIHGARKRKPFRLPCIEGSDGFHLKESMILPGNYGTALIWSLEFRWIAKGHRVIE
jgi:hypothetical protein